MTSIFPLKLAAEELVDPAINIAATIGSIRKEMNREIDEHELK